MKNVLLIIAVLCLIGIADAGNGTAIIDLRAKGSAMDLNVDILGSNYNDSVKVLPHGWVDIELPEGYYYFDLKDGDKGQPEHREAQINTDQISWVSFLGHAVSPIRYPRKCECPWDCKKVWQEERNHTVHHEAETRVVTVIDEPAYCTYLQLRGHSEYRVNGGTWKWGTCPIVSQFLLNCVVPVCEERWIPGEVIETCYPAVTHEETITDSEAWDELIIDSPAGWIEVCPKVC